MSERAPRQWTGTAAPGFHPLGEYWEAEDLAGVFSGGVWWPGSPLVHRLLTGSEITLCGLPIPDNASGWDLGIREGVRDCPECLEGEDRWQEEAEKEDEDLGWLADMNRAASGRGRREKGKKKRSSAGG